MKKFTLAVTALIISAISVFGKEGIYLEFKLSSTSSKMSMSGTNKSYYSDGDSKNITTVEINGMPNGPMVIATLVLKNQPGKAFSINEKDKTYMETDITKAQENREDDEYDITVHGKESVNGYNATHVTVLNKKTQHSSEMWLSKDVKGYADYTVVKSKYLGGSKFFAALKAKDAEGFVVRMEVTTDRGGTMQMDLVKAEKKDIDGSVFSLDGYTKSAGNSSPGGVERPNVQQLQNMTPEERKKYIEDMKAKYGK